MSTNRRLAAIMVADVVGFSRMMEQDEAGTLAALKERRKAILEPVVKEHGGRIVKVMGDGVLVEFGSAVNAVQGAIELQKQMAAANEGVEEAKRVVLRIGINLGDVIGEGSDIYGEGVNIAARLEPLAKPGGITVSGGVFDQVRGKIAETPESQGEHKVKNIGQPVRVYSYNPNTSLPSRGVALVLPDRPSIAVLPFENMSGDVEQEYFADGIVEEIITALSRFRQLFVIARNSSFAYKGRSVDVKQVGRELGVRYVLEGSVRKAGNKVRVTGQLIDATTGAHLWADRFDGALEDIFDLQDQVTASVVGAIAPKLELAEIERSRRKPTESLDAYDHYLRGLAAIYQWRRDDTREALAQFYRAFELDPGFAAAYAMAARCYSVLKAGGWSTDHARERADAARLARRALELDKDDALVLASYGIAVAFVAGDLDDGRAMIDRALALNPNFAWGWLYSGWVRIWSGDLDAGLEHLERSLRLSPNDRHIFSMQSGMAFGHLLAGRYGEAMKWAEAAIRENPNVLIATCTAAASAALAGHVAQAKRAADRVRELNPTLRLSGLSDWFPVRRAEHAARWQEGLRKAGLPE